MKGTCRPLKRLTAGIGRRTTGRSSQPTLLLRPQRPLQLLLRRLLPRPRSFPVARPATAGGLLAARLGRLVRACCLMGFLAWGSAGGALGGQLVIKVVDRDSGEPLTCRMHLYQANGKPRRVEKTAYWHDHFVVPGQIVLNLPNGQYTFELERGPEYATRSGHFTIENFADDVKVVDMKRHVDMAAAGWYSGDLLVRRPPAEMKLLLSAEDLRLAEVVGAINGKAENAGGGSPVRRAAAPASDHNSSAAPAAAQEPSLTWLGDEQGYYRFTAAAFGKGMPALSLLGVPRPYPLPWDGGPLDAAAIVEARDQGVAWVDAVAGFSWELPVLVAHRQIDSFQLAPPTITRLGSDDVETDGLPRDRRKFPPPWGHAQWIQHIYNQLLECGLRIPPSAASGSGISPNPVGYNRMYVHVDGPFEPARWFESLKAGRVCVTNGPLLQPRVSGQLPGHVFSAPEGQSIELEIGLTLSTREPISYLEIIKDGQVDKSIRFQEYAASGRLPPVVFDKSGWFRIRAVTDLPKVYRFASTGPYYVEVGYQRRISRQAVQFFLEWLDQSESRLEKLPAAQRSKLAPAYTEARRFWQKLLEQANAP